MAKITIQIPEPKTEYSQEDQRQILQALRTLQSQLNFSYENDIKNKQDAFTYFLSWQYNIKVQPIVLQQPT